MRAFHEHIRGSQQWLENVVIDDPAGQVLEEQIAFLFVYIPCGALNAAALQACGQGCRIDQDFSAIGRWRSSRWVMILW